MSGKDSTGKAEVYSFWACLGGGRNPALSLCLDHQRSSHVIVSAAEGDSTYFYACNRRVGLQLIAAARAHTQWQVDPFTSVLLTGCHLRHDVTVAGRTFIYVTHHLLATLLRIIMLPKPRRLDNLLRVAERNPPMVWVRIVETS